MKGDSTRSDQTKRLIIDSFMEIYETKNYFTITVKDICKKASINRSTFYYHFENIDSMLRKIENEILDEMKECGTHIMYVDLKARSELNKPHKKTTKKPSIQSWCIFDYIFKKRKYILTLLNPNSDPYFKNSFKKLVHSEIERSLKAVNCSYGKNQNYVIQYMTSGIVDTIHYWLKHEDLSIEEVTEIMLKLSSSNPFLTTQLP